MIAGALWLAACGGHASDGEGRPIETRATGAEAPVVAEAPPALVEPVADTSGAAVPDDPMAQPSVEALIAVLEPVAAQGTTSAGMPSIHASVAACRAPPEALRDDEHCALESTAAWDARTERWIVLDVDFSEGGPEHWALSSETASEARELGRGGVDRAGLAALPRATRGMERLAAPTSLVRRAATTEFSINAYAPLVELDGALDGWLLHLSTNADLDHPEHVLSLVRAADGQRVELGRRRAELSSCDGDGWTCGDDGHDCEADELRREGRLCVEPLGISLVALSPDGRSLLVQGTRQVAGHGGYPPHHWVAAIPELP